MPRVAQRKLAFFFIVRIGLFFFGGWNRGWIFVKIWNFGIGFVVHKCCELWRSKAAKIVGGSSSFTHVFPGSQSPLNLLSVFNFPEKKTQERVI